MNFKLKSLVILCLVLGVIAQNGFGQSKKKKSNVEEYFDESGSIVHRLWYGGGFNLGFSGTSGFSAFSLGVSPMVGYKVLENNKLSVGPRLTLDYSYYKGTGTDGAVHSAQPISYAVGLFGRYKVLSNVFAHVEIEQENRESIAVVTNGFENFFVIDTDGKPLTERQGRQNFYIGAGYTSGGVLAYEIVVLYNVLEPENSVNLPFDVRFGLTYKF